MSNPENRKRPHVWHASPEINGLIRVYAAKRGVTPNEAAEELIQGNVGTIVDAAGEIKRLTRERDELQEKLHHATLAGEDDSHALDVARADLESAREATRRADAEIERVTADWRAALAETERVKALALERAGADATEIKRLREQYEAALDAVPSVAESRADQATITALRSELAEVRAALETKGAAALPDDFEAKIAERAPGWKGTLPELRARVITLGFSRYDALATDAAKRAAERGR